LSHLPFLVILGALTGFTASAHAAPETWSPRVELSMSGAALAALGESQAGWDLSDEARAAFPIGIAAGVRIARFYAGLEGSVGIGIPGDSPPENGICDISARDGGTRCSVRLDSVLGVLRFHALTVRDWEAWAGLGVGREWLRFTARLPTLQSTDPNVPREGPLEPRFALTGWWLDVRAGVDYAPLAWLRVGIFVTFASGRYSVRDIDTASCRGIPCRDVTIDDPAFHHWAGAGLRLAAVLPEATEY
jgi:hypothetical protein